MNVLHITPACNGYEEVTLLANQVNRKNNMSVIEKNGELYYTGGFIINDTPQIRAVLDPMSRDEQYEFIKSFKMDPFVKFYYEEE